MSPTSETPPELIPLPQPRNASGDLRRVGVEVEFSGMTEENAARVLADTLGGAASEKKPGEWSVTGTTLGDFECYLDSAPLNKMDRDGRIIIGEDNLHTAVLSVRGVDLRFNESAQQQQYLQQQQGGAQNSQAQLLEQLRGMQYLDGPTAATLMERIVNDGINPLNQAIQQRDQALAHLYKEYKLGIIGRGTLYRDLQSWWAIKRGKEDPNTLIGHSFTNNKKINHLVARFDR